MESASVGLIVNTWTTSSRTLHDRNSLLKKWKIVIMAKTLFQCRDSMIVSWKINLPQSPLFFQCVVALPTHSWIPAVNTIISHSICVYCFCRKVTILLYFYCISLPETISPLQWEALMHFELFFWCIKENMYCFSFCGYFQDKIFYKTKARNCPA